MLFMTYPPGMDYYSKFCISQNNSDHYLITTALPFLM